MASYWAVLLTHAIRFLFLLIYLLSARLMGRVGLPATPINPRLAGLAIARCLNMNREEVGAISHHCPCSAQGQMVTGKKPLLLMPSGHFLAGP